MLARKHGWLEHIWAPAHGWMCVPISPSMHVHGEWAEYADEQGMANRKIWTVHMLNLGVLPAGTTYPVV